MATRWGIVQYVPKHRVKKTCSCLLCDLSYIGILYIIIVFIETFGGKAVCYVLKLYNNSSVRFCNVVQIEKLRWLPLFELAYNLTILNL